jgi:hypothetical protein
MALPLLAGAVHDTDADPASGVALTEVGAAGTEINAACQVSDAIVDPFAGDPPKRTVTWR